MRMIALIADIYVLYHAKDLKLTEDDKEILEEGAPENGKILLKPGDAVTDPLFPECEEL